MRSTPSTHRNPTDESHNGAALSPVRERTRQGDETPATHREEWKELGTGGGRDVCC